MTAKVVQLTDTGPALSVVPAQTLPAKRKPKLVPAIIPEPLQWTDEGSFRAARREWENLVMCDDELNPSARTVILRVATHASVHGFPFPSAKVLAADLGKGFSVRTVQYGLRRGVERGWLMPMNRLGFSGPMSRALSMDEGIADRIRVRLEGNKLMKQFRRERRLRGER